MAVERKPMTADELLRLPDDGTRRELIDGELRELESQMARFAGMRDREDWPAHPFFGRLSRRSWGVLGYKHLDHHLRQFGV